MPLLIAYFDTMPLPKGQGKKERTHKTSWGGPFWVFPPGLSKNHRSGWVGFQPEQINQKLQLANMTLLNSVLSLVKFSAIHS